MQPSKTCNLQGLGVRKWQFWTTATRKLTDFRDIPRPWGSSGVDLLEEEPSSFPSTGENYYPLYLFLIWLIFKEGRVTFPLVTKALKRVSTEETNPGTAPGTCPRGTIFTIGCATRASTGLTPQMENTALDPFSAILFCKGINRHCIGIPSPRVQRGVRVSLL